MIEEYQRLKRGPRLSLLRQPRETKLLNHQCHIPKYKIIRKANRSYLQIGADRESKGGILERLNCGREGTRMLILQSGPLTEKWHLREFECDHS